MLYEEENLAMMIPADTDVTCPSCDEEFTLVRDVYDGDTVFCDNCDSKLIAENGDLEVFDDDIYDEDEDEDEEDNPQRPIGQNKIKSN